MRVRPTAIRASQLGHRLGPALVEQSLFTREQILNKGARRFRRVRNVRPVIRGLVGRREHEENVTCLHGIAGAATIVSIWPDADAERTFSIFIASTMPTAWPARTDRALGTCNATSVPPIGERKASQPGCIASTASCECSSFAILNTRLKPADAAWGDCLRLTPPAPLHGDRHTQYRCGPAMNSSLRTSFCSTGDWFRHPLSGIRTAPGRRGPSIPETTGRERRRQASPAAHQIRDGSLRRHNRPSRREHLCRRTD